MFRTLSQVFFFSLMLGMTQCSSGSSTGMGTQNATSTGDTAATCSAACPAYVNACCAPGKPGCSVADCEGLCTSPESDHPHCNMSQWYATYAAMLRCADANQCKAGCTAEAQAVDDCS